MARGGARATKLKAGAGGRLVSKRSKTGDPQCSSAMSAVVNARHGNPIGMALDVAHAILGQCRSKARALKLASQHEAAGNTLRAQALRHRAATDSTNKRDRSQLAGVLRKQRADLRTRIAAEKASKAPMVSHRPTPMARPKATDTRPFHEQVKAAAERVPAEKRFGDSKVFIHHAYEQHQKAGGQKMTLAEFKRRVVDERSRLDLHRADLVNAMRRSYVKGSTARIEGVDAVNAQWNFIKVSPKTATGPKLSGNRQEIFSTKTESRIPANESAKARDLVQRLRRRRKGN